MFSGLTDKHRVNLDEVELREAGLPPDWEELDLDMIEIPTDALRRDRLLRLIRKITTQHRKFRIEVILASAGRAASLPDFSSDREKTDKLQRLIKRFPSRKHS